MTDVVVVSGDAPEEEPVIEGEVLRAETAEEVTDAAVQIAEIEANKEITLAVIAAETEEARDEAWRESRIAELNAELEACRTENSTLRETVSRLETELSTLLASVAPEPPPSPTPPESASVDPTQVSQTPLAPVVPPAEPVKKRRPVRFI